MKDNIIEIEFVEKFNPYHDHRNGQFTSPDGISMVTFSANANTKAGKLAIERETTRQKATEKVKNNPYAHLRPEKLDEMIGDNDAEKRAAFRWANEKLRDGSKIGDSAINNKIKAARKKLDELNEKGDLLHTAWLYAKEYNKNIPF